MRITRPNRRRFLSVSAGIAALGSYKKASADDLGGPRTAYGARSPYEKSVRVFAPSVTPGTGASRTPLQDMRGILTPSSLHFERHHAGVPGIDPQKHELLIHGLVDRPLVFTLSDLDRLPSVSKILFLECSGNTGAEWKGSSPDPQQSHGLLSCSEWTGVPLSALLNEAGLKPEAKWVLAEGADAARIATSIPMAKALDDVFVAYGQNGEAIRPEQGYPLRLVVPGWEGNLWVKWLHRLHVIDQPAMTREESVYQTDPLPDGTARIFTFEMDAKSVIARPAGGQRLSHGPGRYEITGLAWSGRAAVRRVEVSTDGGKTWRDAELQKPVLSQALTRFRLPWHWDGKAASLQSRCTDETGYLQPAREQLIAVRGTNSVYHYNGIKVWFVHEDGNVSNV